MRASNKLTTDYSHCPYTNIIVFSQHSRLCYLQPTSKQFFHRSLFIHSLALFSSRYFTTRSCPFSTAYIRAVLPFFVSEKFTSAPLSFRYFTTSSCPFSAANKGVLPLLFAIDISAPFSCRYFTTSSCPFFAANIKAVLPLLFAFIHLSFILQQISQHDRVLFPQHASVPSFQIRH